LALLYGRLKGLLQKQKGDGASHATQTLKAAMETQQALRSTNGLRLDLLTKL
jgi:hypothetical protein